IQTKPPPTAIPLVFRDGVVTVFSSLPFQSTSHAASVRESGSGRWYAAACAPDIFCSAIHKPSGVTAIPLGYPGGLLKSFVVLAIRAEDFPGDCCPSLRAADDCCATASLPVAAAKPAPMPAVRNCRLVIETSTSV